MDKKQKADAIRSLRVVLPVVCPRFSAKSSNVLHVYSTIILNQVLMSDPLNDENPQATTYMS